MIRKIACVAICAALLSSMCWTSPEAVACGPFVPEAAFVLRTRPDYPAEAFARGSLGILQPSYHHEYLFVAYRALNNQPLTATERAVWLQIFGDKPEDFREAAQENPKNADWIELWKKESAVVLGQPVKNDLFNQGYGVMRFASDGGRYISYYNCLPDAFRNALDTLHARQKQLVAQNTAIVGWTVAQAKVFANCHERFENGKSTTALVLPDPANPEDPPVIKKDRAYQIAAAHFYAADFDEAAKEFDAIASDKESPWRASAPYLAARAVLRRATTMEEGSTEFKAGLEAAATQFNRISGDPINKDWAAPSRRLLNFIMIRLHAEVRLRELGSSLAHARSDANYSQDMQDYLWLLDHANLWWRPGEAPPPMDDLTDWIETLRGATPQDFGHSLTRWKSTNSNAWLVAALIKSSADDAQNSRLIEAAAHLPKDSPAHLTAAYHCLRLRLAAGQREQVRNEIDAALTNLPNGTAESGRNQLLARRLELARNLDEFVKFAPRKPAATSYDGEELLDPPDAFRKDPTDSNPSKSVESYLDRDATTVLNEQFPLSVWIKILERPDVPANIRRELALGGWTRAILLGKPDAAAAFASHVAATVPELQTELDAWKSATADAKQFAALKILLRNPGLHPYVLTGYQRLSKLDAFDLYRQNWWCAFRDQAASDTVESDRAAPARVTLPWDPANDGNSDIASPRKTPEAGFIARDERVEGRIEFQSLISLPNGPNWLGQQVLNYAKSHPDDPSVPEALHRVVRATRSGCTDVSSGKYSKAAFETLHRNYPASEWTKKTPYWFGTN